MFFFSRTLQAKFLKNVGSNKPARQRNHDVSGGYLVWKCQSRAAGCIFDLSFLLLNANFESKMVINRYLRCLFGHKKVIVDILRSSFIGSLKLLVCYTHCSVQHALRYLPRLPDTSYDSILDKAFYLKSQNALHSEIDRKIHIKPINQ